MKLVTASKMQEIDAIAVRQFNIPSLTLMENAGKKTAELVLQRVSPGDNVVVVVGRGNNGGDGFVIARYLSEAGINVTVQMLTVPDDLSEDARTNFDRLSGLFPRPVILNEVKDLHNAKLIIDAIFGTGLGHEVSGKFAKAIEAMNASGRPIIAVDMPSGLSADTGKPQGVAIRARETVTFGLPKIGQVLSPGTDYVKKLHVVDIGFPKQLLDDYKVDTHLITTDLFKKCFSEREQTAHKNDFGHVLVIAGSTGKMGAGWLTSKAVLRSGGGLVTYAIPNEAFAKFDTKFAEVMVEPVDDMEKGFFVRVSEDRIRKIAAGKNAVAIGPGIGTDSETEEFVVDIVAKLNLPVVIDADGLNNIAKHLNIIPRRKPDTILTPHAGEMARLCGIDKKAVQENRIGVARDLAQKYRTYVVLKGNRTIVATPAGDVYINPTGNPGMATAGAGDALTGAISGFLAQGIPTLQAVIAAVYIHGLAGDLASEKIGEMGLIAGDIIEQIPHAIKLVQGVMSS